MFMLCDSFVCVLYHKHALHVFSFPPFLCSPQGGDMFNPRIVSSFVSCRCHLHILHFCITGRPCETEVSDAKIRSCSVFCDFVTTMVTLCVEIAKIAEIAHIYMGNALCRLILTKRPGIWPQPVLQFVSVLVAWSDVEVNSPMHTHGHV